MIEQDLITSARFMGASSMLVMAVIVAWVNRSKVQSQVYNCSRWMICVACLLLGIHNLLQFYGHFREQSVTLAWIINLVFYVPIIFTFNLGERNMLYAGLNMKRPICIAVSLTLLCYVLIVIGFFTGTIFNDGKPYMTMTCVVAFLLFVETLQMAWIMEHDLKHLNKRLTDENLEECHRFLRYTAQSMRWMLYLSFFTPWIGMFGNLTLNGLYGLLMFGVILWFVIGFCLYGHDMPEVIQVNDEIEEAALIEVETAETHTGELDETKEHIGKWVSERKYINPDITVSLAFQQMNISATAFKYYLEQNTHFNYFNNWLTHLRIEEAKRLMLEHPNYTLDFIASACGYSNRSTLSRAFKAQEGINPTQWMEEHKKRK